MSTIDAARGTTVDQRPELSPAQQFNENIGQLIRMFLTANSSYLRKHTVVVKYSPRFAWTYAIRHFKAGVLVETSLSMSNPAFDSILARIEGGCCEILQGRTEAIRFQEPAPEVRHA